MSNKHDAFEARLWAPNPDLEQKKPVAGIMAMDPLPLEEQRGVWPAVTESLPRSAAVRTPLRQRVRVVGQCLRDLWQALVALVGIARAAESEDIAESILARQPAAAQWKLELINEYIQIALQRANDDARRSFEVRQIEAEERRQQIELMKQRYEAAVARGEAHGS